MAEPSYRAYVDSKVRNAAILAEIDAYTALATQSRERARKTLIDEGIYDEDGNLRPDYGGDPIEFINREISDTLNRTLTELAADVHELVEDCTGEAPASPCINICAVIVDTCVGCRRTLDEIDRWGKMTNREKRQILARING